MDDNENSSLRICLDGHANSFALNKQNTCIAVAGRSREFFWFVLIISEAQFTICDRF